MILRPNQVKAKRSDRSLGEQHQAAYVTPAVVMLAAGAVFERLEYGAAAALHYTLTLAPALLLAAIIGRAITARYLTRLAQLRRVAERMEAGQYESVPDEAVDGCADEFTDLSRAFNHMVEVIATREASQRDQNLALAELNRRMDTVLNATNDGIALLDRDGRFTLVNRRFGELLGVRSDALLNSPVADAQPLLTGRLAKPERLMGRLGSLTELDLTHPVGVTEEIIEVDAGEQRFIQVYTAPVSDHQGEIAGRILALHDITRETEVDRMKTDFINVVSHELRTPLTSIRGYTELLFSGQAGPVDDLQREFLSIIHGSATRLNNLINDILDISRLESGKYEVKMERVAYEDVVHDVLRLMKAAADGKEISIDASFPADWPAVRGDADKIAQVLTNLVSNSIKYTQRGGWIKVSLELSGGSITTCVADNGIGISAEDQRKLFTKFFRADNSSTREAGGTGLGLAIVKTMVELLGGAVWVDSDAGKGSRFYFTLPLYGNAELSGDSQPLATEDPIDGTLSGSIGRAEIQALLAGETVHADAAARLLDRGLGLVLVIDDDIYVRERLQHSLHRMGYGVISAGSLDEVMMRARVHRPDVILLDMMMDAEGPASAVMTGFAIQNALQQDPATAALPIVAYSLTGDAIHGSMSLGSFSFLSKPVPAQMLLRSLREHYGEGFELSLLMVKFDGDASELRTLRLLFSDEHVALEIAHTPESAISLAINRRPHAILLDIPDGTAYSDKLALNKARRQMTDLLRALKFEEDVSQVPLILLSRTIGEGMEHFHLGAPDGAALPDSLDYLGQQVAIILRDKGRGGIQGIGRPPLPNLIAAKSVP